ncbi:MAG: hypothetical protein K6G01_02665 [Eubacterium sp.]|nr:hypothetical protein [Eubacterium sp.]
MKEFLLKIREPDTGDSLKKKLLESLGFIMIGVLFGVLQKWMDGRAFEDVPFLAQLDIANFFGELPVWILLGTLISVYARTPLRAAVNTFLFLIGMVSGYYVYCNFVLGFLPRSYMMIWIVMSCVSFFLAYLCWYAKGNGIIAIVLSAAIIGILFAQAVNLTQGFYIFSVLKLITWGCAVLILRRKPKEFAWMMVISVLIAIFLQIQPYAYLL